MSYESRIWNSEVIWSTDYADHSYDVGSALKRPATAVLVKNNEAALTGDPIYIRFNNDANQVISIAGGETLSVEFAVFQINAKNAGSSGSTDGNITIIAS